MDKDYCKRISCLTASSATPLSRESKRATVIKFRLLYYCDGTIWLAQTKKQLCLMNVSLFALTVKIVISVVLHYGNAHSLILDRVQIRWVMHYQ